MGKSKIKISVITPTTRAKGLFLVEKALRAQTFNKTSKDFIVEWIIVGSKNVLDEYVKLKHVKSFPHGRPMELDGVIVVYIEEPPKKKNQLWTLNKAYNVAINEARGKLIISWQDYTFAGPNTLEEFWKHYEEEPNTLVSAVGNKYESEKWDVMVWKDPRIRDDVESFYPCYFQDIEWNLCSVPKKALCDIGGFDEGADSLYLGMDGFSVNERLWDLGGYDFKLDQSIKSYSLPHKRRDDWEELNGMYGGYEERRNSLVSLGQWPVLKYLK
jgi:hypothetical protein